MRKIPVIILLIFQTVCLLAQSTSPNSDRSQSPYFLVNQADGAPAAAFPLQATSTTVNIAGVIADVTVKQTYQNNGTSAIEAIYVFPASTGAAVYAMRMQIGDRIIEAEIAEKEAARQQYEQAKATGRRAALLEQERPNVFQMNVANILPGDQVEVTLRYTELLVPEAGVYSFVYPTVVGPRYTTGHETDNNGYTQMPYTAANTLPAYTFDLAVHLNGGMPLHDVSSSTHRLKISRTNPQSAEITLDPSEKQGGNRDFILNYNLKGDKIETGMLVYDDGEEQFFLYMAQPPKQVQPNLIPAREYIFLLDVSGSMRGFPLTVMKELLENLTKNLQPTDRFNILIFAGGNQLWSETSREATPDNLAEALRFLNGLQGGGGTSLLPALARCLALPRHQEDLSRSILLITDGYVAVENEAFELVRNNLNQSNLFVFGIGSSVNRHLLEGLARVGQGQQFVVTTEAEASPQAERFRQYISQPLFTRIQTHFNGFNAYDVEPTTLPDVLGDRPVLLFGKFKGDAQGELALEGYVLEQPAAARGSWWPFGKASTPTPTAQLKTIRFPVAQAKADKRNAALKYLWAREKIRNLADYNMGSLAAEDRAETIRLGLKYNLLTSFTSFVAVEKQVANDDPNQLVRVKQPLPMPEGVSNDAIGFELHIRGISGAELFADGKFQPSWPWLVVGVVLFFIAFRFRQSWRTLFPLLLLGMMSLGTTACSNSFENAPRQTQPFATVTFILGQDKTATNPYYTTALSYFSTDSLESTPLVVSTCRSLLEVRQFLAQHPPQGGAWRRVNLVTHGNEWTGITVPVLPEGKRCSREELQLAIQSGAFPPLPDNLVDDQTLVAIFGCNVGKDTLLLQTLSSAFGGYDARRPLVSSARYFNIFRKEGVAFGRHLAECRFVAFPAGKFPGNRHLAARFADKYPCDTTDWLPALLTLAPQSTVDPYVHFFNIPAEWIVVYPAAAARPQPHGPSEILAWVQAQPDLLRQLENMQLAPAAFRWELQAIELQGHPALAARGQTIIYSLLQPLVDEHDAYLHTDVREEEFYAVAH